MPAMHMVATSRFLCLVPLVLWDDAELGRMHTVRLQVPRAGWRLPPSYPLAQLMLPGTHGGCPLAHSLVSMVQTLKPRCDSSCSLKERVRKLNNNQAEER